MLIKLLRVLLFPLAVLYDVVTRVRNHLYNSGYKPSFQFEVYTICVGNLNTGGSGKTPMVEYLIRLLHDRHRVATLSRGYGRKSSGFRLASEADNALTLGDEPFQLFRKFGELVTVAVGEERALAIPTILHEAPDTNLILLDDAFQHRTVRPHLTILLTEHAHPFFRDHVLPTGNLREARAGAARADVVVVTKCPPDLSQAARQQFQESIQRYAGERPVFFSQIAYGEPVGFGAPWPISSSIVLLSGIAHTDALLRHLHQRFKIVKHFAFADHHTYTESEVAAAVATAREQGCSVLTTEKDMVRLLHPSFDSLVQSVGFFYLPIKMEWLENGAEFDAMVLQHANSGVKQW